MAACEDSRHKHLRTEPCTKEGFFADEETFIPPHSCDHEIGVSANFGRNLIANSISLMEAMIPGQARQLSLLKHIDGRSIPSDARVCKHFANAATTAHQNQLKASGNQASPRGVPHTPAVRSYAEVVAHQPHQPPKFGTCLFCEPIRSSTAANLQAPKIGAKLASDFDVVVGTFMCKACQGHLSRAKAKELTGRCEPSNADYRRALFDKINSLTAQNEELWVRLQLTEAQEQKLQKVSALNS
jgi:hypothetical protein